MAGTKKRIQHDDVVRQFGARLRGLRTSRGMTQGDLAAAAGVSTAYVGRLERGGAAPGIDLVAKLTAALGTTASDLLDGSDQPDPTGVIRAQARRHFETLMQSDDEAVLSLVAQLLGKLATAGGG